MAGGSLIKVLETKNLKRWEKVTMEARLILESLIQSGKEIADGATQYAEKHLGLPTDAEQQKTVLKNVGTGAAIGAATTLLLGTKAGRRIAGKVAAAGTIATVGALAYQAYKRWSQNHGTTPSAEDAPLAALSGPAADKRNLTILRAMVAAANADGSIDPSEKAAIAAQLQTMDVSEESKAWLQREFQTPRTPWNVASLADTPAAAAEIYTFSSLIIDEANPSEEAYLEELRAALQLEPGLAADLKAQFAR
jgi:uncharacterized membrane protein YebE (DUF533 family)